MATENAEECLEIFNTLQQDNWISVEDRLPEKNEDVLTFHNEGYIDVCIYEFRADENVFMVTDTCVVLEKVTHWQPLQEPPVKK